LEASFRLGFFSSVVLIILFFVGDFISTGVVVGLGRRRSASLPGSFLYWTTARIPIGRELSSPPPIQESDIIHHSAGSPSFSFLLISISSLDASGVASWNSLLNHAASISASPNVVYPSITSSTRNIPCPGPSCSSMASYVCRARHLTRHLLANASASRSSSVPYLH